MGDFIIYENCYYCGSPIRDQIIEFDEFGKEIQLPYCTDICRNKDPESYNAIQQTISENIEYNKEGGKYNYLVKQIKNDPHLNKIVEKKKDNYSSNYNPRNPKNKIHKYVTTIYSSLGIIIIIIIFIAIYKSNTRSFNLIIFGRYLPILIIPLIREIWSDMKH